MGAWAYAGDDPGLQLFTLAVQTWKPAVSVPGRLLEVGCCETTFLEHMRDVSDRLDLVGVDWRARRSEFAVTVKGDVRDPDLFDRESFDAVVGLSVIEHIGLGHYNKDPLDPEGDIKAMQNIASWLKPGGWVYLDVPYSPEGFKLHGTKCRSYDSDTLPGRLVVGTGLTVRGLNFVEPDRCREWYPPGLMPPFTRDPKHPFYYAAMLLEKPK